SHLAKSISQTFNDSSGHVTAKLSRSTMTFFTQGQLEAIAGALGDTADGLTGSEIAFLISACAMVDPGPLTKRDRIYNAFAESQNSRQARTHILAFIRKAMDPAKYARNPE